MRRVWTCTEPFDYDGRFYQFRNVFPDVRPVQRPYPELLFGGSSPGALTMGAQHCDTFAMFGEPLAETAERMATFRRMAEGFGRPAPKFNISFRSILGRTEGETWHKAQTILANL
jgi:alkanesulfonate monooxygenase